MALRTLLLLLLAAPATGKEPIESLDMETLLRSDIRGGEQGSFASRLSEYGVRPELHGYLSVEAKDNFPDGVFTFDLHHMTVMMRTEVSRWVIAEISWEWEHIGKNFYIPFAFADLVGDEAFIVRAGYFPVPIGVFNEYL